MKNDPAIAAIFVVTLLMLFVILAVCGEEMVRWWQKRQCKRGKHTRGKEFQKHPSGCWAIGHVYWRCKHCEYEQFVKEKINYD
jgi:hypothetical protein